MSSSSSPRTASPPPSSVRRVIVASLIGTSLEWYDFFIYGTAAALVFNKLFFPSFEPLVGTLLAFATYAVGFIARPLGGIVFGHYGDKLGRKNVLVVTLLLMGIATFAIGLMPTYATIGVWAPILLVALRFLQGLGLGGEWGGAVLMTLESGDDRRRGLNASWPQVGRADRPAPRQRRPVADGRAHHGRGVPVVGLAGAVPAQRAARARRSLDPADASPRARCSRRSRAEDTKARAPIVEVLRAYPKQVLLAIGAGSASTSPSTRSSCSSRRTSPPTSSCRAATPSTRCSSRRPCQVFLIPWFGHLSDRFGRRPVYLFGAIGAAVWVFVFFALLDTGSFALIVLATVVALVFHAAMYGPQAAFIAEMFPTQVRYTGASMGYQLAGILGGALAPIISVALLDRFDTSLVVSVYVVLMLVAHDRLRAARAGDLAARPHGRPDERTTAPEAARMTAVSIDLNSDLGEGFGAWTLGDDDALLDVVTSANVACGFHAGDPDILRRVCGLAAERGVVDRRAGRLPRPARLRPARHGRRPADADQRGHLPDRGAGRLRPGRRHPGQLRQAARGAVQRRRAPRGAGGRRGRGGPPVRRVAAR